MANPWNQYRRFMELKTVYYITLTIGNWKRYKITNLRPVSKICASYPPLRCPTLSRSPQWDLTQEVWTSQIIMDLGAFCKTKFTGYHPCIHHKTFFERVD